MTNKPLQPLLFDGLLTGVDVDSLRQSIARRLAFSVGKDTITATARDWFHATAFMTRDRRLDKIHLRSHLCPSL